MLSLATGIFVLAIVVYAVAVLERAGLLRQRVALRAEFLWASQGVCCLFAIQIGIYARHLIAR